jgi:hypothetical protein
MVCGILMSRTKVSRDKMIVKKWGETSMVVVVWQYRWPMGCNVR